MKTRIVLKAMIQTKLCSDCSEKGPALVYEATWRRDSRGIFFYEDLESESRSLEY